MSLLTVGVCALPAFAAPADHLIISEVLVKTQAPVATNGSPFIEIVNPTAAAMPMDDVFLTNGTAAPATYYYNIALLDPATSNPGGGSAGAFHARFPAGYTLAAGGSIAISINGSTEFMAAYGRNPDFELFEDGAAPDGVPELREAFGGSINAGLGGAGNVPALADAASSLVLYSWDGMANLVQDLDYLIWGTDNSVRIDKTGISVGGDTYLADTAAALQEAAAAAGPDFGSALRRVNTDEGTETTTGGNGITGHDETSENLATTFPVVVGHEPPAANPGFPAAPIFTAGSFDPAAPIAGQAVTLAISVMDQDEVEEVVFYYSVDGGAAQGMGGTQTGQFDWAATVPAQAEGAVVAWWCTATNTETVAATYPAGSPNFASTWTVAADPGGGDGPAKLLLTEISTTGTQQEYVEIYNPGSVAVDLSDYYLTDANYAADNQFYWRIAEGNPSMATVGGGDFNDFHARFPDGFTMAANDTIVITVAGSDSFLGHFGYNPDLELFEDGAAADAVPDMRWVWGDASHNSIVDLTDTPSNGLPTLTNAAETVILYHWEAGNDLVTDIDVFTWQDPSNTSVNLFFNKSNDLNHSYLPEVGTSNALAFGTANTFSNSYHRTDANESGQTPTGSNGVDGRDETSENCKNNFASMPYDPAGPSGEVPVVDPEKLLITQVCTKDTGAEFVEIHNPGTGAVDLSNYYLTDAVSELNTRYYWQIAMGTPTNDTVGGGADGDFHAKFPAGFSLAAGDTIVIAVNGSTPFNAAYGFLPDIKLFENDDDDDDQPAMEYIFGDSNNNSVINRTGSGAGQPSSPDLVDSAETVVLYHWTPGEDRVVDIDVYFWRDASSTDTDFLFDKSGVTVGSHTYLPETATTAQTPFNSETDPGFAFHRSDGNEGNQTATGSNGVDGRDETSENFGSTFQMATADPVRPPEEPVGGDAIKLLITEVATLGTQQEFVEIYNPSGQTVDMSDYYLTDAIYSGGDGQFYWKIAQGNPSQTNVGGGAFYDFHARFPDGFSIDAGDTIVVSIAGSESYEGHFGFNPHIELLEDGNFADDIPDMRWIFGDVNSNSIYGETTPGLTNSGEPLILYHWTTGEDKVTDIDVFTWRGSSSSTSTFFFNKSGVVVGSHTYLSELGTDNALYFETDPDFGNSYHRIDPTEGAQVPSGSNGVAGRDETSEDVRNTFAIQPYDPARSEGGGGPDPGGPPAELPIDLYVEARTFIPNMDAGFPIRFISRPRDHSETRVRIFDLEGRVIKTVFDSRFDGSPPTNITDPNQGRFTWDGRDSTFELVKGGMYVVHLSVVRIEDGEEEVITAPVVVGTRLSK